jgi:hypothetical protein
MTITEQHTETTLTREFIEGKIALCLREIETCIAYQQERHPDWEFALMGEMDWRIALYDWTEELELIEL